jgi:hypothetical protein
LIAPVNHEDLAGCPAVVGDRHGQNIPRLVVAVNLIKHKERGRIIVDNLHGTDGPHLKAIYLHIATVSWGECVGVLHSLAHRTHCKSDVGAVLEALHTLEIAVYDVRSAA